jgi:hypothetical protein
MNATSGNAPAGQSVSVKALLINSALVIFMHQPGKLETVSRALHKKADQVHRGALLLTPGFSPVSTRLLFSVNRFNGLPPS